MGRRLQTNEERVTDIVITTATVEIQVMRIGSKQMTLAVFRQLPHRDIFGEDGSLVALPWGWVNYDRGEGGSKPFVFSCDGVLYRAMVDVAMSRSLTVHAEMENRKLAQPYYDDKTGRYVSEERAPTGLWLVQGVRPCWGSYVLPLRFATQTDAMFYCHARGEAVEVLECAPQLFIGV